MTDNSGITPFQHFDANRKNWGKANPSLRDNGGQLPAGLNKITNTTARTIEVKLLDPNKNMMTLMYGIEEYNRTKQSKAIMYGHRYWWDFHNQPRRNPIMRPLLHNGKKPR